MILLRDNGNKDPHCEYIYRFMYLYHFDINGNINGIFSSMY